MNRYAFFRGRLRQVKSCWVWLFKLLNIGIELPAHDVALREVMEAMELYHRKCEVYIRG